MTRWIEATEVASLLAAIHYAIAMDRPPRTEPHSAIDATARAVGAAKTIDRGRIVTGFLAGDAESYAWAAAAPISSSPNTVPRGYAISTPRRAPAP